MNYNQSLSPPQEGIGALYFNHDAALILSVLMTFVVSFIAE